MYDLGLLFSDLNSFNRDYMVCTDWNIYCESESVTHSVMSDSLRPHGCRPSVFPLSMEFSRQEYWSGWPFPSLGESSWFRDRTQVSCTSESESCWVMFDSLQPHELHSPWNSPGQNTGVGSLSLLQGIFPIQGSNPGLPHCRQILYQLSHMGSITWPFIDKVCQPLGYTTIVTTIIIYDLSGFLWVRNLGAIQPALS